MIEKYTRSSWYSMQWRCRAVPHYQHRKICNHWTGPNGFQNFLNDMGIRPQGLTLDRIDNNGHYSCGHCSECKTNNWPANCQWITPYEQLKDLRVDLTGKKFGHLTVLNLTGRTAKYKTTGALWKCRCDCGRVCHGQRGPLVRGSKTTCGECNLRFRNACGKKNLNSWSYQVIKDLVAAGRWSQVQISKAVDLHHSMVSRIVNNISQSKGFYDIVVDWDKLPGPQIKLPARGGTRRSYKEQVLELLRGDYTSREIAETVGCSLNYARKVIYLRDKSTV